MTHTAGGLRGAGGRKGRGRPVEGLGRSGEGEGEGLEWGRIGRREKVLQLMELQQAG